MKILRPKRSFLFIILFIFVVLSCDRHQNPVVHDIPASDTSLVDAVILDQLVAEINEGRYGEVHSVLIDRNGRLVFEITETVSTFATPTGSSLVNCQTPAASFHL